MELIVAVLVGGGVGWVMARLSRSGRNMALAIVLGAVGAVVAAYVVGLLGLQIRVRLEQIVAAVVGAVILLLAVRR